MLQTAHSELTALAAVAQRAPSQQTASRFGLVQEFWATPERSASDPTSDVLELTLTDSYRINWLQFDLARFPHSIRAEYYDDDSRSWLPLIEPGGVPVERHLIGSVPAVLPPPRAVPGHQNPQHSFVGHWHTEQIPLAPTRVRRLRLVLTRTLGALGPVDVYGNASPYSLAVRNFSLGYQIATRDDVPRTLPVLDDGDNGSYGASFASTDDAVGSTVDFSLRTLDASRAILDNAEDAVWKSEPQPDPNCVVNLYADVRDAHNNATVVDRVFLDPTVTGAHLSLYFAKVGAPTAFISGDSPLSSNQVDATANVTVDTDGLHFSVGGAYPASESIIVDNATLDYRPDLPGWIGLVTTPSFDQPSKSAGLIPAPSTFATAYPLVQGNVISTDTTAASAALDAVNGTQHTVWFSFIAPRDDTFTFTTDGTNYDTQMTVWQMPSGSTSASALVRLVTNDDDDSGLYPSNTGLGSRGGPSAVSVAVTAGTQLYIAVGGANGAPAVDASGLLILNYPDLGSVTAGTFLTDQGNGLYVLGGTYEDNGNKTYTVHGATDLGDGTYSLPLIQATPDPTPTSQTYNVLFDCGMWLLAWTDTGLSLQFSTGETIDLPVYFQSGLQTAIVVSYDGASFQLWASNSVDTQSSSIPAPAGWSAATAPFLAVGSDLTRTFFGQSDVASLVIKQEQPPADGSAYAADPRAYTAVTEYASDEPSTSHTNAILRFDPQTTLVSDDFPWCLFGGDHSRYEAMTWTPVPRDFTCQRGWLKLPPVKAKFWKLEFTHLQPTYADVFVPGQQLVRRFPKSVLDDYAQREALANPPVHPADDVHANLASYTNYVDTPSVVSTGGTGQGFTNAEVFVAQDLQAAERLYRSQGENWAYQPLMSKLTAPRFNTSQVHVYQTELVTRTSKVAYQVGLRNLKFARSVASTTYDTPQYEDEFLDTVNLDTGNTSWVYRDDEVALTSGLSSEAQIVSQVMQSSRNVRGVQFAAQQSPPRQALADANFDDPTHQRWTAVGDATILDPVKSPAFDQLTPVARTLSKGFWEDIAPLYGTWGAIEASGVTWGELQAGNGSAANDPSGNGIASEAITLLDGGYVHAAARVWADRDLFAPLWLQLVDSTTQVVLAEEPTTVRRGQVAEWHTSYEIGSARGQGGITWGELAGETNYSTFTDAFQRSDSTGLGRMDSGQVWQAGVSWNGSQRVPLNIASNAATVATAGARSTIDTGTPWGSLVLTMGTWVNPGTPVGLATLGTLVLRSDGKVIDPNTGYIYATLTLASGDALQFDFMPTSQVPSAHTSGADASIRSWSMVITRNGAFVTTVSTAQPFSSVRGLSGAVGQTWTSFAWTPSPITVPVETQLYQFPIPRDGSWDSSGTIWTQGDGRTWQLTGSFTSVDNGIVQAVQAPAGQSFEFDVNTDDLYGAMTFQVTLSGTTTDTTSYYVAKLDDGPQSQLYLRADGALVQSSPALGTVVLKAGAVTSFSGATTVLFARTASLSAAFKSTYSLSNGYDQTLVFLNGTTVVGTYQGSGLFLNTARGVMGTDGSKISGFTWGPDLGSIALGSGARTWGQVAGMDANGIETYTWADVARSTKALSGPVVARVVQKAATQDVWFMDALAAYLDPIVWEFSNDGGLSWTPASTIRNNPRGVVMLDTTGPSASNQLRYRVTAYDTDTWLAHLVIRPWYVGFMRDLPTSPEGPEGPNLNPMDAYRPIEEDPNFQVWSEPIPREFYFAFRSVLPEVAATRARIPFTSERIMAG